MVTDVNFWTGAIVVLISFTLFGIEQVGIEIENSFGHDANDLPLLRNIEDLITLSPRINSYTHNAKNR